MTHPPHALDGPLGTEPIEEIKLSKAPLVNVLAQIRYPKNPTLATEAAPNHLYQALKHRYPILREPEQLNVVVGPNGVTQVGGERIVQLTDRRATWSVNVGSTFATLSTTTYETRDDFCERFTDVAEALVKIAEPVVYDRLGLRYVNRVEGGAFDHIREFVRPEVLGGLNMPAAAPVELQHSVTDSLFFDGHVGIQARWGVLPAGAAHDPTLPPSQSKSWILDLDVFGREQADFIADDLHFELQQFANRAYRFFRWCVTPAGLREFGAGE